MFRFYFIFIFLALCSFSSPLKAVDCTQYISGQNTDYVGVSISYCEYKETGGDLFYSDIIKKNMVFNITSVNGIIPKIYVQNNVVEEYTVNIATSPDLKIGSLDISQDGGIYKKGFLDIKNNSKVTFINEGLKVENARVTDSSLTFADHSSNEINQLEATSNSIIALKEGAQLTIRGGKGIRNKLEVTEGSTIIFDYAKIEDPKNDDEKAFRVVNFTLSGSNIKKTGTGEVILQNSILSGPVNINVSNGILDIGKIGLSEEGTFIVSDTGELKFKEGIFDATVTGAGVLHNVADNSSIKSTISVNSDKGAGGKVISETGTLTISNSNIDVLEVKSGDVIVNTFLNPTYINTLELSGKASFSSGDRNNNNSTIKNISITDNAIFNYNNNNFYERKENGQLDKSKPILQSLTIASGGIFYFSGLSDLYLDGNDFTIKAVDGGIIRVESFSNKTLTLRNMEVARVDLQASSGFKALDIDDTVKIGRLDIDTQVPNNVFDINGSNITDIRMKRRGTLNILGDATIGNFYNESSAAPEINILGGDIDSVSLGGSGTVTIDGSANINSIVLSGAENVTLNGGYVDDFQVTTLNSRAEVNIIDGEIGKFTLGHKINLKLENTKIGIYEIKVEKETFDFTEKQVKNLWLEGAGTTVTVGNSDTAQQLQGFKLNKGTIIYKYDQDNTFTSWITDIDHTQVFPPKCDPDKEKCDEDEEEKEPEIIYDSELIIEAGDAKITVGEVKLENLDLRSGTVNVTDTFEIERRLALNVGDSNKLSEERESFYTIYSKGDVKLAGVLEVNFTSTNELLLGMDNEFGVIHSETKIDIDEEADFDFKTNLAKWFTAENELSDDYTTYIVNVKRVDSYSTVLTRDTKASGGILEVGSFLDDVLMQNIEMTPEMRVIITGLDTKSNDANDLSRNISKLMPVSNLAYANSVRSNTSKSIDFLSMELRDFTNLEDNVWVKLRYNATNLKNKNDVIGYTESSNAIQAGYTRIINSKLILGGSVAYTGGNLDANYSNYKENFDAFNISLGADYLLSSDIYLNGILSFSTTNFDNNRNLSFANTKTTSNVSVNDITAHIEAGYVSILPDEYYNFNATYNVFYSVSSAMIGSYKEEGIGKLNVDGATVLINDIGIGANFDQELLYDREEVSLKPYFMVAGGLRIYSGTTTDFKFIDTKSDKMRISNGSYLPLFVKAGFGVDYIANWATISVGYRYETDITKYNDSTFSLTFKHSF